MTDVNIYPQPAIIRLISVRYENIFEIYIPTITKIEEGVHNVIVLGAGLTISANVLNNNHIGFINNFSFLQRINSTYQFILNHYINKLTFRRVIYGI